MYTDLDHPDQFDHMSTDYTVQVVNSSYSTHHIERIEHIDRTSYIVRTCTDIDHTDQVGHMYTE